MQSIPPCPTCGVRKVKRYGHRTYRRDSIEHAKGWKRTALTILFDVWKPGTNEAAFEFVGCVDCGLMIYEPRPSDAEISEKYAFIGGMGDATPSKSEDLERTALRARRVYKMLSKHMPHGATRVMDFGGGDGRLLKEFVERDFVCALVDYADRPIAGVTKIATTEKDIPVDQTFDAIVCSHVVEHLGSPLQCLMELRRSLADDGAMYVEVPYEVFDQLPAESEPVTHVNFFTPESLTNLLQEAGYEVVRCNIDLYPHPQGHWSLCVGAIARHGRGQKIRRKNGIAGLDRALKPSTGRRLAVRLARRFYPSVAKIRYGA